MFTRIYKTLGEGYDLSLSKILISFKNRYEFSLRKYNVRGNINDKVCL